MIEIEHSYDEREARLQARAVSKGRHGRVRSVTPIVRVDDWVGGDPAVCDALGALRMYGEEHPRDVRFEEGRIHATHAAVATLSAGQARALGLPERSPLTLATDVSGVIGSPSFRLNTRWLEAGVPVATKRTGAFLESPHGTFLIPDPLFSAVELADAFDAETSDLPRSLRRRNRDGIIRGS